MRAAIFSGPGKLDVTTVPVPHIANADEVLMKVEACGVCGTDLHILSDPPGHPATVGAILGHEFAGKILQVGPDVTHLKPGDRVCADPNLICGVCRYCRDGYPNMCERMTTLGIFLNGGFAEYVVAPARALFPIPDILAPEVAAFIEPLGCVLNATREVKLQPGDTAVVLGGGPIGLYFAMMFKASGAAKVIVSEIAEFRKAYALAVGADRVVNPKTGNLKEAVEAELGGGADVVVDAVGGLISDALDVVRRGGQVIAFGQNLHAKNEVTPYWITRHEVTIQGIYIAKNTFPRAIKILAADLLPVRKLITHRVGLDGIVQAIADMRLGRAMKIIVEPGL